MRCLRIFSVMVVLVTLLMIYFSSLHLETANSYKIELRHFTTQADDTHSLPTQPSKPETSTPEFLKVSVSDNLKQIIPQNAAYWNRLLYVALGNLEDPSTANRTWPGCREMNDEHLRINVHDFKTYPDIFQDFLQVMSCRSAPVLISQPDKCVSRKGDESNQTYLLFAIKTTPGNFEKRQVVRETWGQEGTFGKGLRVRTVFLLGNSPPDSPDLSALLSFEAEHFRDLLQWDFQESLLNLTLKMNMFLQWTLRHCPQVSFVFSGDDDVFVNTPALIAYLQTLAPSKASQLYMGHIINTASPIRDRKSKYYIPESFYNGPYPPYAGGGGFLISGALLHRLYSLSHVIPFFPIDDVYVGMCTTALGVSPEAHAGFRTFDVREEDRGNVCVHKNLILIHQRSPRQMKNLWKGIHSPFLSC